MTEDILERLKATTKINGAYPKDIEDAIKEIERLRKAVQTLDNEAQELWMKLEGIRC